MYIGPKDLAIYLHTYTYIHVYTKTHVCTCKYVYWPPAYIHVHTHMYIQKHLFAHVNMYIGHLRTYMYIHICIYKYGCACEYVFWPHRSGPVHTYTYRHITYMCVHANMYVHTYVTFSCQIQSMPKTFICLFIYACICMHIHTYMWTHIYMYLHAYMYIHTHVPFGCLVQSRPQRLGHLCSTLHKSRCSVLQFRAVCCSLSQCVAVLAALCQPIVNPAQRA